jgi:hypothetical protein
MPQGDSFFYLIGEKNRLGVSRYNQGEPIFSLHASMDAQSCACRRLGDFFVVP